MSVTHGNPHYPIAEADLPASWAVEFLGEVIREVVGAARDHELADLVGGDAAFALHLFGAGELQGNVRGDRLTQRDALQIEVAWRRRAVEARQQFLQLAESSDMLGIA